MAPEKIVKDLFGDSQRSFRPKVNRVSYTPYKLKTALEVWQKIAFYYGIDVEMLPETKHVWRELIKIPFGRTTSYEDIARRINNPKGIRAVATANGDNRLAIIVPCHRVIGKDGKLHGYGGGLWRKKWMIEHERNHCNPSK